MTQASIPKSRVDTLGFDLTAAVADFTRSLAAHAKTVNRPAPTADPLVEQIVRGHGGKFKVFDDTPKPTPADIRRSLVAAVNQEVDDRVNAIASPPRRQLAQMDMMDLAARERTPEEDTRFAELQASAQRVSDVIRHGLLLQVEIEEAQDKGLEGWKPHRWPT